jgi:hypothetical protein
MTTVGSWAALLEHVFSCSLKQVSHIVLPQASQVLSESSNGRPQKPQYVPANMFRKCLIQ